MYKAERLFTVLWTVQERVRLEQGMTKKGSII
jgi:hypothetical protein